MDFPPFVDLAQSAIRMSTPLALGGLGCLFNQRTGIWNIGLEGKMLVGCFFAVFVSVYTQNAWLGVLGAVTAGLFLGLLMAIFIVTFRADQIIVGIALNILSLGLTTYLLLILLGVRGSFGPQHVVALEPVCVQMLNKIPYFGEILIGYSPLVYLSWLGVLVSAVLLYKTSFGLGLRAVGEHTGTASTAGVSVGKMQYTGLMIAGALSGMAGAQLTLGFLPIFSENMTSGRGFIAFSAVVLGNADPLRVFLAALMFGAAEAIGMALQSSNLPVHFPLMVPYVVTIIVLVISQLRKAQVGKSD